jgi:hypothetical protein
VQVLTSKIDEFKREHRSEVTRLRQVLEAVHGENLALRRVLTSTASRTRSCEQAAFATVCPHGDLQL